MKFTKMHGLGNDYVYVDATRERIADPVALAIAVSDRHSGIGSDGLIVIEPSSQADLRMTIYNADGSRAQMCGNGIRCVAKYAIDRQLVANRNFQIETDAGVRAVECVRSDGSMAVIRIDMGAPSLNVKSIPAIVDAQRLVDYPMTFSGLELEITCLSMGNPHAVIFVKSLGDVSLAELGPAIECAPQFPQRINAHFAQVDAGDRVRVITWERGSGPTQACGSGACAVCVAGALTSRTQRRVRVSLPGGDLDIEWAQNDHVFMTGSAFEVFSGDWPSTS